MAAIFFSPFIADHVVYLHLFTPLYSVLLTNDTMTYPVEGDKSLEDE